MNEITISPMLVYLSIGFFVGFISGVVVAVAVKDSMFGMEKMLVTLVSLMWLIFHGIGFAKGIEVPTLFNIVGATALGHSTGIDFVSPILRWYSHKSKK